MDACKIDIDYNWINVGESVTLASCIADPYRLLDALENINEDLDYGYVSYSVGDLCLTAMPSSLCGFIQSVLVSKPLWIPEAQFLIRSADTSELVVCSADAMLLADVGPNLTSAEMDRICTANDLTGGVYQIVCGTPPTTLGDVLTCSSEQWWSGFSRLRSELLALDDIVSRNRADYLSKSNRDWHQNISRLRAIRI